MAEYQVGFIFTRCFLQKRIDISESISVEPLSPTGFKGQIHNARALLNLAGHRVTQCFVRRAIDNFRETGQSVCVHIREVDAPDARSAMEKSRAQAESIAGALSVLSVNPAVPVAMFARSQRDPGGVDFAIPPDPIIKHATNIHGYLDIFPDLCDLALREPKIALLLNLYRASLRESDVDKKLLFQLILLEEISDENPGTLAQRLSAFCARHNVVGDFDSIAAQCEIVLPEGRSVLDALVKIRNAVAHNGELTEEGLKQYNGEWVVPLIEDKSKLYRLVSEAIRYVFAVLSGHSRDKTATKVELKPGEKFELKFD